MIGSQSQVSDRFQKAEKEAKKKNEYLIEKGKVKLKTREKKSYRSYPEE